MMHDYAITKDVSDVRDEVIERVIHNQQEYKRNFD